MDHPREYSEPQFTTNLNAFHGDGDNRIVADSSNGVDGHFTWVRPLMHCINGRADLVRWHRQDATPVAMKRMVPAWVRRNMGAEQIERPGIDRHSEDSLTEIGVYDRLDIIEDPGQHYILRMLQCYEVDLQSLRSDDDGWEDTYGQKDEFMFEPALPIVALVLEYAGGGELMSRIASGPDGRPGPLPMGELRSYMSQLSQAVSHLHHNNIGHRDISLENILLKPVDDQLVVRLMDFGQACELRDGDAQPYRYFSCVGKKYYRPPEVYIPSTANWPVTARLPDLRNMPQREGRALFPPVQAYSRTGYCLQVMFPHAALAHKPGDYVDAWPAGYNAERLDVFMVGICLFLLYTRRPAWGQALLVDKAFNRVLREHRGHLSGLIKELAALPEADLVEMPARLAQTLDQMTSMDPDRRGSMRTHHTVLAGF
mmetsp:Transcript_64924/g.120839  ORF Transcript_64924/g.120839 Transcript_64924/m.120839 type:complete len:427 (-) Transcript_64924:115-1395(-)